MTMIVIGHHFAGHAIPLPFLNSSNDGGIELPVSVRILRDGLAQRIFEVLQNIPQPLLPPAGIGVGAAARNADNGPAGSTIAATGSARGPHTPVALTAGAKPRAYAAGVCRAGAAQRFRD